MDHSGDDGASPSELGHTHTDGAPTIPHRRTYPRSPPSIAPDGSFWGRRGVYSRQDTLKTRSSCPKDPATLATVPQFPRPQRKIPGTTKRHRTRDIATAIILLDAPTSPPAPSHTAAPARGVSEKRKEPTCSWSTSHSVRTRSQVGTQATQPPATEKPGSPTTKGQAKSSDSQKIPNIRGSLDVRAAKEK